MFCKKCNTLKSKEDFYQTIKNICKKCWIDKVKKREAKLRENPEWLEKEKERLRAKYYRLNYKDQHKPTADKKKDIIKRYNEKYPEKRRAKMLSQRLPCKKGNELHHWSYKEEHAKDVIELSKSEHALLHRYIIYDQERMMYRTLDGILLDTKNTHILYFKQINK